MEKLSYLPFQVLQRFIMIDTTGLYISQCIVQTTHGTFLPGGIAIFHCCLHICLLSFTFDDAKVLLFFEICKFWDKKMSFLCHFLPFSISTQSVKDLSTPLFSAASALSFRLHPCRAQLLLFIYIRIYLLVLFRAYNGFARTMVYTHKKAVNRILDLPLLARK